MWIFRTTEEIFHRLTDHSQQVLQFDLRKKVIVASIDVLPRGLDNFGHDPSLEKFSDFVWEKHQQRPGNTVPTLITGLLKKIRTPKISWLDTLHPLVNPPDSRLSDPC